MSLTPEGPLWSGLCLPPVLRSHTAPLDLGSHPTTGRFLNEVCDVPLLCLCTGWSLFENAFTVVHLADPIHPVRFLSGKPSCSAEHVGCLSSELTPISHLQSFSDLTVTIDHSCASPTTWEDSRGRDRALSNSESQNLAQGLALSRHSGNSFNESKKKRMGRSGLRS